MDMKNIIINVKKLRAVLVTCAVALLGGGCVTQQFILGSDNEVRERVIDTQEAAMARLKLALEYLHHGQTAQAKLNLDRALTIDDSIDGIHASFAYYYQNVGEDDKAEQSFHRALRQYPDNANTRNNYGAFLCEQLRYEAANTQFLRAIATPENNIMANSYENAGLCALRDHKWQRAKEHLVKVLGYESRRVRSILGLTQAYLETNELDNADNYLRKYSQLFAQTPQSLWLAIQIEDKRDNTSLVNSLGHQLVKTYPNSDEAHLFQAKTL